MFNEGFISAINKVSNVNNFSNFSFPKMFTMCDGGETLKSSKCFFKSPDKPCRYQRGGEQLGCRLRQYISLWILRWDREYYTPQTLEYLTIQHRDENTQRYIDFYSQVIERDDAEVGSMLETSKKLMCSTCVKRKPQTEFTLSSSLARFNSTVNTYKVLSCLVCELLGDS